MFRYLIVVPDDDETGEASCGEDSTDFSALESMMLITGAAFSVDSTFSDSSLDAAFLLSSLSSCSSCSSSLQSASSSFFNSTSALPFESFPVESSRLLPTSGAGTTSSAGGSSSLTCNTSTFSSSAATASTSTTGVATALPRPPRFFLRSTFGVGVAALAAVRGVRLERPTAAGVFSSTTWMTSTSSSSSAGAAAGGCWGGSSGSFGAAFGVTGSSRVVVRAVVDCSDLDSRTAGMLNGASGTARQYLVCSTITFWRLLSKPHLWQW
uniref:(northern house mosquito) hypothetical protein n=1 Tax=Culex pipiens TaxID=7175 RepID=A0A8D8JNZ6_CULPI